MVKEAEPKFEQSGDQRVVELVRLKQIISSKCNNLQKLEDINSRRSSVAVVNEIQTVRAEITVAKIDRYKLMTDTERITTLGTALGELEFLESIKPEGVEFQSSMFDVLSVAFGFIPEEISPSLQNALDFIVLENPWLSATGSN